MTALERRRHACVRQREVTFLPARDERGLRPIVSGDPLGPAKGVLVGLAICVVVWVLIGLAAGGVL